MEVKSFSITAALLVIALAFVGAFLANQATSYNSYDAAGRKNGQTKPTANVPTGRRGNRRAA